MMTADGFDEAIIGSITSYGRSETVLYSTKKIIEIMMERDGMTAEDAMEFFNFNILGSYNGDGVPAFLNDHEQRLYYL